MIKLESVEQFHEQINSGEKVVFLFSADWCPDCRVIEPLLPEIEEKYHSLTFIYVDRDQYIDVCAENDIFGIPSFLAFSGGKEAGRFVSKDRKTQQEIETFLNGLDI
ncbi:thioredoxin family protein [Aquibacillus koreensis]|uniref:Thioredoxin family protein n=1 Tax=Aquibacillus koreensis TaxID=279446 RepID=A0A9X3WI01_9BACI|nr:thioredoxin family protein [Aquibacillus koreensis]MCT2535021.1 thioredoxin family protein [Aquibacillus koreensis]MDC3419308.1 thioredoxin family protein [Aquibacillus koreensis]